MYFRNSLVESHNCKSMGRFDEAMLQAQEYEDFIPRFDALGKKINVAARFNLWLVYMRLYVGLGDFDKALEMADKAFGTVFNNPMQKLDELHTLYEVDKITAEKIRIRHYFLFALAGCVLLCVALGIWVFSALVFIQIFVHFKNYILLCRIFE